MREFTFSRPTFYFQSHLTDLPCAHADTISFIIPPQYTEGRALNGFPERYAYRIEMKYKVEGMKKQNTMALGIN